MTTNSRIRHQVDLPDVDRRDDAPEHNASSLDQVRNILFGREIKDVETRLESMRAQLSEQLEDSQSVLTSRMHAFEEFMKKRLDEVNHQVQLERERRNTELEAFNSNLRGALRDLQSQLTALDDSTISKDAALRQHVASEIHGVTNRLEQLSKEMRMAVLDEAEAIRSEKMDKGTLIALFSDLAERLAADPPNTKSP